MPKQGWIDFTDVRPHGHLVVALVLRSRRPAMDKARVGSFRLLLERLIERLVPSGDYATRIVPQNGVAEIYCVFEKKADAQHFANAVRARPPREHPGWASQWSFVLHSHEHRRSRPH
jgi:hypothetical protein